MISSGLTTIEKGRHTELLAQTAFISQGYTVLESITPSEVFDMAIKSPNEKRIYYVQVKTSFVRNEERYGSEYVVVRGTKGNGEVYTKDEIDFFVTVYNGDVYMFANRECSEYWCKAEEVAERWTKVSPKN